MTIRERLDRLNIWQRLGVVLSILWLGYAAIYSAASTFPIDIEPALSARTGCIYSTKADVSGSECDRIYDDVIAATDLKFRLGVFGLMIAMIPATWLTVWAALASLRWVWAGRKPSGA